MTKDEASKKALEAQEYWGGVDFDIETTPSKRPWVGLTDDDVLALRPHYKFSRKLIAEVEAKLKEKNK
jgi:hypothetical protein